MNLSIIKPAILAAMPFMLLFIAGIVDAIGFIHLKNGLFVSFMSGNTTHVAMLLSDHQYNQSMYYIGVILLFVAGITIGEMVAILHKKNYRWLVMSAVSILLFSAIFIEQVTLPIVTNFVLAFAMGLQNIALRITISKAMPLTFATAFLANTGRELAMLLLGQGDKNVFIKQFCLWLSIFIGAIVGSQLMAFSLSYALVVPIVLCSCIAVLLFWLKELTNED
ncbi:YoaK family protein [Photobacterium toruni]|uniref:YoaK family protein n=1 Tax=Photobacterium toruni TaxID=1935446 RepID=UPI00210F3AC1|nr:YoaK family protein [Photobacterium toruni]MEC6815108.1 YoaK family protein [Photobacterium toruni]